MEELQRCWKVPCIGQYLSLFRHVFKFPEMDIEELEESLICPRSDLLQTIIISFLQACCRRKSIGSDNWQEYLNYLLHRKWTKSKKRRNPIPNGRDFFQLKLFTKIEILYSLCLYRLDCLNVEKAMKAMDADALRVQSLGCDSLGNVYWYFYGTRLYKEEPTAKRKNWEEEWKEQKDSSIIKKRRPGRPKKLELDNNSEKPNKKKGSILSLNSKSRWSVVCSSLLDWETFAEKFKSSKAKSEMALYALITKNFLPALHDLYDEKEKRRRKKLMELAPQKPSTRLESKKGNKNEHSESELSGSEDTRQRKKTRSSNDRVTMLEARIKNTKEKNGNSVDDDHWATEMHQITDSYLDGKIADLVIVSDSNLYAKLHKVMSKIKLHKNAWPFLNPVEEAIAPGYYNIVRDPIDLSVMERKIQTKVYETLGQVDRDMQKMVFNSRLYNGADSDYTDMAKKLLKVFRENLTSELISTRGFHKIREVNVNYKVMKRRAKKMRGRLPPTVEKLKMKAKHRKKQQRISNMQGLEMLAEASEQALKDAHLTETEVFVPSTHSRPLKSKTYPNLKIMPTQSHPLYMMEKLSASSCSSSDSDSNNKEGSQSDHEVQTRSIAPRLTQLNNDDTCPDITSDCASPEFNNNSTLLSPMGDSSSNERFSEIPDLSKSELDDACTMLGIQNEGTKSDALSSLSSLLCRIIKDNTEFDITSVQNMNCDEANTNSPSSTVLSEEVKSDSDSLYSSVSHSQNKVQPSRPSSKCDLVGFRPLSEITTVDASILGISTDTNCGAGEDGVPCSSEPSPNYRANINSEGLLQDNLDVSPCLPHSSFGYPNSSPTYINNRSPQMYSGLLNDMITKAKSMSPDSQFQDLPQGSPPNGFDPLANLPSRISPNYCFIPSPPGMVNYSPSSVPMTNGNCIANDEIRLSPNDKNVPKTTLPNSLPFHVPNGVMPLFLSQASSFPMTTTSGQFTFLPSIAQVSRPIATMNSCLPSVISPPSISQVTSTSSETLLPRKKVDILSNNEKSSASNSIPRTKKRKRAIAPKPTQDAKVLSDASATPPTNDSYRNEIFQRSPICATGFSSPPDKVSSSINDPLPGLNDHGTMPINNHFWSPKEALPVTHSIPLHPMFTTQSHDSSMISSNGYSGMNLGQRLPPISMISGRTFEPFNHFGQTPNSLSVCGSERDVGSKVSSVPNTLFPIMYTVPNGTNLPNSIICQNNFQVTKAAEGSVSAPTYLMQGIPQRPIQSVNSMAPHQLRHPNYLNIPSFMMPHQQTLHSILPSPILPNPVDIDSETNSNLSGSKTVPVYTVLQNVPSRSR